MTGTETTTYADRVAARLAACGSPDERRIAALAHIAVAVDVARDDAELASDVRAVLAALEQVSS